MHTNRGPLAVVQVLEIAGGCEIMGKGSRCRDGLRAWGARSPRRRSLKTEDLRTYYFRD